MRSPDFRGTFRQQRRRLVSRKRLRRPARWQDESNGSWQDYLSMSEVIGGSSAAGPIEFSIAPIRQRAPTNDLRM